MQEAQPSGHHDLGDPAIDDVGVAELLAVIRRHIWVLTGVVASILALTGIVLSLLPRQYTAEALIMIESEGTNRFVSLESVVAGLSGDAESVQSEAHVLASRALAYRVIQRLGLETDPEFTEDADGQSATVAYSSVIDEFLDRLKVVPLEKSRVIAVRFSSKDAEKAHLIANTIVDEHLQTRLQAKFELTRQASSWLTERIEELRANVASAEAAVEQARREFGLLEADGLTLGSQQLAQLNSQLVMARTARAEAEARLQQVQRVSSDRAGAAATIEVLQSPLIQRLREQEAEVERRVAELSSELGTKHPRMIQLQAEATNLRERIADEIAKIVTGLRNEVSVARARERSLARSMEQLKDAAAIANQDEIELRALEREAEANRNLLNTLLTRQKETLSQNIDFQQPDVTIVSRAQVPAEPSFPRVGIILGLVFISSLVIGMVAIFVLELLDNGFRSGEQFEQLTGAPSIGFIPAVDKPENYRNLACYLAEEPETAFGESMRTLNWTLKLAFPDEPPRIILITSAMPAEGKTTIASGLATVESKPDKSILLVDADIRRPSCHEIAGVNRKPGLTDVLSGTAKLDDVLVESKLSSLRVLPAGTPSPNAQNLLGSHKMEKLLKGLSEQFDLIVIDSPPMLAAADARILCRIADATVLVVRWGKTRRRVARLAVNQLDAAGARLAGGLLSMVDVKRYALYGYGDSGAYSGDLSTYYAG